MVIKYTNPRLRYVRTHPGSGGPACSDGGEGWGWRWLPPANWGELCLHPSPPLLHAGPPNPRCVRTYVSLGFVHAMTTVV